MLKKIKIVIIILPLFLFSCKENKYDNIQITIYKNKDVIKVISNYDSIASFEKAVRKGTKVEYIKDTDDYYFSVFCETNDGVDYFSIKDNYILSKKGLYIIDEKFENIFGLKPSLSQASRSYIQQY
jgi:hypothetical protein